MDNTPDKAGFYWGRWRDDKNSHPVILEVTGEAPFLIVHMHTFGARRQKPLLVGVDSLGPFTRSELCDFTFGPRIEEAVMDFTPVAPTS